MKKITAIGDFNFSNQQKARLKNLGELKIIPVPDSAKQWLQKVQGADIILSNGAYLLDNLYNLKNVFITYPYIELGVFDSNKLKKNGVLVANTQGSNKDAIIEWVVFMILSLFREFPTWLNIAKNIPLFLGQSLISKKVLIVGKGSIGTKLGTVCQSLGMEVDFFRRSDNLLKKSAKADLIINCLNCNTSSENLLDEKFFMSLKKGAHYISFVRQFTYDLDGLIKSLDKNILAGAAIDCDPEKPGDTSNNFYQKILKHKKILATPHIAFSTKQAVTNGLEFAIQNIEAFAKGKPKNILVKT